MHPLQRRSLFAILSLAEQAIQQAKAMLAQDPASGPHSTVREPQRGTNHPGESDYLSETEEEQIERQLEEDRLSMKAEDEQRMKQLWGEQE